ncbi:hypothetical protein [Dyadobacter tibetensis]|uniref:hypothetical protein n=1 Tax=Dyadobacter tibetensis TaxID=1211851 RepID=UPI0004B49DFC|nr:hypothetical protein [Dyadobacter tibetensis]
MKKVLFCCLIIFMGACKDNNKGEEPAPDHSNEFVGEYWTNTVNGNNSTAQTWVVSRLDKNLLGIEYTVEYTFKDLGKEIKVTDKYTFDEVVVIDALNFKINEDAVYSDNGFEKIRRVSGDGVKIRDAAGSTKIGITLTLTDPGKSPVVTDYLEFKKR